MSSIYLYILTTCVEGLAATLIGLHGRTYRWSSRTTTASRGRPWRSAYPLLSGRSHAYSFAREAIERPEPNSTLGWNLTHGTALGSGWNTQIRIIALLSLTRLVSG